VTLWLHVRAPFAAFRWMQAGVFRGTLPIIPPSAAWGLVLNLAGVDTRADPVPGSREVTTQIRPDAPALRIACGARGEPQRGLLYQQLHSYPVGNDGKDLAPRTHGAKYWIAPVRREVLLDLDVVLGVEADDPSLLARVARGLRGELPDQRYGLPFAGDNNFLIDRIDVLPAPIPARWYAPVRDTDTDTEPAPGSCRVTVGIDRADSGRTTSRLVAPTEESPHPPDAAWIWVPRAPGQ
jgi:CRISPR-associated protein Cas5t